MERKTVTTQIDPDGILRLEVSFAPEDADQVVQVTVSPSQKTRRQWRPSFFTEVVGQWEGELVRPEQGELRELEEWD